MQSRERNRNFLSNYVLVGIIIFFISCPMTISIALIKNDGFSSELIHVNSPPSPFFNPNLTLLSLKNHTNQNGYSSSLIYDDGHYLMKISYGNPKVTYYHIVDTGSDISWIQCLPCTHCYPSVYDPFSPNNSKSFRLEKSPNNETMTYNIEYEDDSHTRGELARETITLGSGLHKIKFKKFLFGCGHDNVGMLPHKSGGLVGLNLNIKSFIFQLREIHHGKFSYCMAPPRSTLPGKISFGNMAIVSDNKVMKAPLILDTNYYIMLTAITVKTGKLKYSPDSYSKSNNSSKVNFQLKLLINTGAKVLFLPHSLCSEVEEKLKKHIRKPPVGPQSGYNLCYSSSLLDTEIPKIKLHFRGMILVLIGLHTFDQIDEGHRCLTILPSNDSFQLGYMPQVNFLVGYDLDDKKISFQPTICGKL